VVAFFDRLVRSLSVQIEVVRASRRQAGRSSRPTREMSEATPPLASSLRRCSGGCRVPPRRDRRENGGGEASRRCAWCRTIPESPSGLPSRDERAHRGRSGQAPIVAEAFRIGLPAQPSWRCAPTCLRTASRGRSTEPRPKNVCSHGEVSA